ncbi:MAG TPA: amino acid adenylation domain-containing protein [Trichormus sp. M33_DOE_039]|nr:amino acid adenylation domain-containing protein [Trichormus sp. M33_DOE_039]
MTISEQTTKTKNVAAIYPLSPMQQGMLFHTLYSPESGIYFEQFSCRISGNLNVTVFKQAWQQVVERHPVLRTLFVWENRKKPLQIVRHQATLPWTEYDWRLCSASEQQQQIEEFLVSDRTQGFKLDQAPLMRCALLRLRENTYEFVASFHHLLVDGWSLPILFQEVFAFYEAGNRGERLSLTTSRSYQDYINWLQHQDITAAENFWRQNLRGFTAPTSLGVDRGVHQQGNFLDITFEFPSETTVAIQSFAQKHRVTLSTLVQGAWAILLSRYTGELDVVFGATVSGRPPSLKGVESMVGLFINTLPVRVQIPEDTAIIPWLQSLQTQQVEREQYAYSPLVDIQGWSEVPRGISLFESLVVFENYPVDAALQEPLESLEIDNVRTFEITNYPLTLVAAARETLSGRIIYDSDRCDADTVTRMAGHFHNLLNAIISQPDLPITKLPLISDTEKQQLISAWNANKKEYSNNYGLHQLFEQQVEKTPNAVALVFGEQTLTYAQLNARANQLAHYLQSLGVKPETLVGVCVERSLEMVVALLGILKAGGAYLPLDPDYPTDRLEFMLADAQVSVLVTQSQWLDILPEFSADKLCLDTDWQFINTLSQENPISQATPESLAYVIYTSGSTGKPKGVMVNHGNVTRLLAATQDWFNFDASDVWTLFHSYAFDFSVWEIWGALLYGGRLVIVPFWVSRDPQVFYQLLRQEQVTVLNQTPSAFRQLIWAEEQEQLKDIQLSLRWVIFGGEALDPTSLLPWFERHGDATPQLVNMYGITETTVHVTFRRLSMADARSRNSVIGVPIPDLQVYILDEYLQPVPVGVRGEMYVGGAGVTRGYLNRPELTQQRFIPNPPVSFRDANANGVPQSSVTSPQSLYKTGDLARYLPDGNIEYLGRIDHQVKIRGFRIELGEIEAALNQHPVVQESVVIARAENSGHQRLVAYIVPDVVKALTVRQLLKLEQQGRLTHQLRYELPNGMTIAHLNQNETEFVYQEIFVEESYLRHGITIQDGDRIFDVGANIGLFSLFVNQHCQNCEIYAFEPIPPVFEVLRLNSELYGLNVHLFECGLSSEVRVAEFTYYPNVSVISGRFANEVEERETIKSFLLNQTVALSDQDIDELLTERLTNQRFTCQLNTISHVIQEHGIPQIDLLKIDAEKSEMEVLAGIKNEDWPKIKQIVVEVHDIDGQLAIITNLLKQHGFELEIEQDTLLQNTGLYNIYGVRSKSPAISKITKEKTWTSPQLLMDDVRQHLEGQLPDYMIPSAFVLLDSLPLTTNGKLDRRALPSPDLEQNRRASFVPPQTETEQAIADIISSVLEIEKIGIHDNFFELGGHSLLATQVVSRLRQTFSIELPVQAIFNHPTIAGLAAIVIAKQLEQVDDDALSQILAEVNQLSSHEVKLQLNRD